MISTKECLLVACTITVSFFLAMIGKDTLIEDAEALKRQEPSYSISWRPQDRRALAMLGDKATKEDWQEMTKCFVKHQLSLDYHFGLHVSKAGGTTLCGLFRKEGCWNDNIDNCWVRRDPLDFSSQWVRKDFRKRFNESFPGNAIENRNAKDVTCDQLYRFMSDNKNLYVVMSENWLPNFGKLCQRSVHEFYHEMGPDYGNKVCKNMLEEPITSAGSTKIFNVTVMIQYFDIVSDKYYSRSLNSKEFYFAPFGLTNNKDYSQRVVLDAALEALRSFDWILLLGVDNSEILQSMGLRYRFAQSNVKSSKNHTSLTAKGHEYLETLNELDRRLWQEAQFLHKLDLESIRSMQTHGKEILLEYELWKKSISREKGKCCGNLCPNHSHFAFVSNYSSINCLS